MGKNGKVSARRTPDDDLDESQFSELNAEYYRGPNPADYLEGRLRLLVIAATAGIPAAPVTFGRFTLSESQAGSHGDEFVPIECVNLLHLAAETLWRIFLSHEDDKCPRLAMARVYRPGALRKLIDTYLQQTTQQRQARIRQVFALNSESDDWSPETIAAVDGTDVFLILTGRLLLTDGPVYNATKHGLGLQSEHSEISFKTDLQGVPVVARAGMWVTALQRDHGGTRSKWQIVMTAVEPDKMLATVNVCLYLIRSIWSVGKATLVDKQDVTLQLPTRPEVEAFMTEQDNYIRRWRRDLAYTDGSEQRILMDLGVRGVAAAAIHPD
jgi:hypothetical protein